MNLFTEELEIYEREATLRIGALGASDARRELEAHLAAEYDARIEMGATPDEARRLALAALGDLKTIAQAESADRAMVWPVVFCPVLATLITWLGIKTPMSDVARTAFILVHIATIVGLCLWGVRTSRRIVWREVLLGALFELPIILLADHAFAPSALGGALVRVSRDAIILIVLRTMIGFSLTELRRAKPRNDTIAGGLLFLGLVGPAIWTNVLGQPPIGAPLLHLGVLWSVVFLAGAARARRPLVVPAALGGAVLAAISLVPFVPPTNPSAGPAVVTAVGMHWGVFAALQALFAQTVLSAICSAGSRFLAQRRVARA